MNSENISNEAENPALNKGDVSGSFISGFKKYRHENNPKEKELHDKFISQIINKNELIDKIVFGTKDQAQNIPKDYLTDREKQIAITLIQWFGSHVGEVFLKDCGYQLNDR